MQFVEHHALERAEQIRRIGAGQQQRELLRRREQNVGRIAALALALRRRRVAGARFEPHRQAHLLHRDFQVARDVDRERLQWRDIECVQPACCGAVSGPRRVELRLRGRMPRSLNSIHSVGRNPASVLPPPVGAISSAERPASPSPAIRAGARAAASRAVRTSARKYPAVPARFEGSRAGSMDVSLRQRRSARGPERLFGARRGKSRLTGFSPPATSAACTCASPWA